MTFSTIIFFVTALLLLTSVQATLTITNPITSTTWTTGKPATITWANDGATSEQTTPLILLNGPVNKLKQIYTIVDSVDVNKLSFTFTVPNTIGSGSDYTVQISVKEPNYSARFTIISNTTATTTSPTSPTGTTKPTTKPSAATKTTSTATTASSNNTSATTTPSQPTRPKSAANTVVPALHSLTTVLGVIVLLLFL